jgi:hypothetical protein
VLDLQKDFRAALKPLQATALFPRDSKPDSHKGNEQIPGISEEIG